MQTPQLRHESAGSSYWLNQLNFLTLNKLTNDETIFSTTLIGIATIGSKISAEDTSVEVSENSRSECCPSLSGFQNDSTLTLPFAPISPREVAACSYD